MGTSEPVKNEASHSTRFPTPSELAQPWTAGRDPDNRREFVAEIVGRALANLEDAMPGAASPTLDEPPTFSELDAASEAYEADIYELSGSADTLDLWVARDLTAQLAAPLGADGLVERSSAVMRVGDERRGEWLRRVSPVALDFCRANPRLGGDLDRFNQICSALDRHKGTGGPIPAREVTIWWVIAGMRLTRLEEASD